MERDVFASLATRIKASVIDSIILLAIFILIPITIGEDVNSDLPLKAFAMFAPVLFLEPFLVAFSGATIGQHLFGIEIVRVDTRSKCPLHIAFLRYLAKVILGGISLIYILFSKKHQAIHDHLAKTFVLISKKKLAKNHQIEKYGEIEQTFHNEYSYPSAIRRFLVFIVWYLVTVFLLGIAFEVGAIYTVPGYSLESEKLPEFLELILSIFSTVIFIVLAVFAAKGFLLGAKRKKNIKSTES